MQPLILMLRPALTGPVATISAVTVEEDASRTKDGPGREVTFCLTDIVGSTGLWDSEPDAMAKALEGHDRFVLEVVERNGGRLIKSKGEGDSTFSVFDSPVAAVASATEIVTGVASWLWPPGGLRVRAAVHTGVVDQRASDWFGPVVNRSARIRGLLEDAGVVCSNITAGIVRDEMPSGFELLDVGERSLLGLRTPERVWAVVGPGLAAPTLAVKTRRPIVEPATTSLVGRDSDIDAVTALVRRHRLVTLVGAAGTGKTRLAREVAARAPLPAGSLLVELADVRDPAAVEATGFKSISVEQGSLGDGPTGLSDTRLLVVVDNCEHVVEAAADAVRALLAATVHVRVVATTREALALRAEVVYRVEPLALPRPDATDVSEVVAAPSVRLFLDRARAARPALVLQGSDMQSVKRIVDLLDGVPLAIELAAASLTSSGLGNLARQLELDTAMLVDERRDVDWRHRSLQAALDTTHERLSPSEQALFRRLSVFARFRADDAVAVAAAPGEGGSTLGTLQALVSKSLVAVEDRDGQASYRLLQPVRLYARGKLSESSEMDIFVDRHAVHTAHSVIDAGRRYFSDQADVVARLHFAAGDVDLSLQHLIQSGPHELGVDVVTALALYWFFNDQLNGRRWVDLTIDDLVGLDERRQLDLRFARGLLHHSGLDVRRAIADLQAAVDGFERLGRRRAEANSRFWLGRAMFLAGRAQNEYEAMFQAGASLADEIGDAVLSAWCRLWLAEPTQSYAPSSDITDRLVKVIEQAQQAGAVHPVGHACSRLGLQALARGDYVAAKRFCDESVTIYRELDDRWQLAGQLASRAEICLASGDVLSAALDVAEATALSIEIGEERGLARAAAILCEYCLASGHEDVAHELASSYHAFYDRLTAKSETLRYFPLPRPDLSAIVSARPLDEACRSAAAKLFE
jgi:predicted ATPase